MRSGSDSGDRPDEQPAAWASYTTAAYQAETSDVTDTAAAWLEEQSQQPFIREVAARSLARLDLRAGERVLELGCGTGVFLPALAERVGSTGRVVAIDHNPAFLAEARERVAAAGLSERVELLEGDAHQLPFGDSSFEAVHVERVLMHVEDPAGVVQEMRRVVRPGGRIVAAEVWAAGATIDGEDRELWARVARELVGGIRNPWIGLNLRAQLVDAGFGDVSGEIVGMFEEELDQVEAEECYRLARDLAGRGEIGSDRAEAAIADLEARRARAAYCGAAFIFIVSGRVPGA